MTEPDCVVVYTKEGRKSGLHLPRRVHALHDLWSPPVDWGLSFFCPTGVYEPPSLTWLLALSLSEVVRHGENVCKLESNSHSITIYIDLRISVFFCYYCRTIKLVNDPGLVTKFVQCG